MTYKLPKKRLIILSSNGVNWTLSNVAKDGSKPYGFMPKNRACSLDFPRVRVTYRLLLRLLLRKVHLFGRVYMRMRLRDWTLSVVEKDGSSPAVSCLKIEPVVSIFPE